MYPSVAAAFVPFSRPLEGWTNDPYVDSENIVTAGMGNAFESVSAFQSAPWRHGIGGPLATPAETAEAYSKLVNSGLAGIGGGSPEFALLTDLRLTDDDIKMLILKKLATNESIIRGQFPGYDSWPANAQFGIHSVSWARGASDYAEGYPKFTAALQQNVPNFLGAADESAINHPVNASITKRNAANKGLFQIAQTVWNGNGSLPFDTVYDSNLKPVSGTGPNNNSTNTASLTPGVASRAGQLLVAAGLAGAAVYVANRKGLFEEVKKALA